MRRPLRVYPTCQILYGRQCLACQVVKSASVSGGIAGYSLLQRQKKRSKAKKSPRHLFTFLDNLLIYKQEGGMDDV